MQFWIIIVIAIHVIVSIALVAAVLLHSGKGAGLSDMFGGGLPVSFSGSSVIERNLDRITLGLGITFGITSFILMLALKGTTG